MKKLGYAIKTMSVLLMLLFVSGQTFAQAKADFSGTWSFNQSKSQMGAPPQGQPPQGQAGQGQRPQGQGGSRMGGGGDMTITQQGNVLTIERTMQGRDGQSRTMSEKYTLDGKESVNEGFGGSSKSIAKWSADGKSLTVTTTRTMSRGGESREITSTNVYTLVEGGKALSVTSTTQTQQGERKTVMVYDKK